MTKPKKGKGTQKRPPRLPGPMWVLGPNAVLADAGLQESPEELARQTAIQSRENQLSWMRRTAAEIGYKFGDPREDPEELQDDLDELEIRIFQVDQEIQSLRASQSMRFPSANEIANLGAAVSYLEAQIASAASANALMGAAVQVMTAFGL
ncbi:MAG TPA: hypothetical protein VIT45_14115 [Allosphingosinicella sp.]